MTVSELIEKLKQLPQDLPVHINDEGGGTLHEDIDAVFDSEDLQPMTLYQALYGDEAAVVITVNSL